MARASLAVALIAALAGCGKVAAPVTQAAASAQADAPVTQASASAKGAAPVTQAAASAQPADIAGIWLPDARRAEPWPTQLPLTPAARSMLESFDPAESDPTTFCMPLGTPRNMLQTEYPLEIVQTPQRILIVLQPSLANAEVRRIPVNGSALPEAPDPSWFGTSRGRWDGATLVVETTGLRPDALVSGNGLRHSDQLHVIERLSLVSDTKHGRMLVDEIELRDPKAYEQPLKTRRYFVEAPQAQLREPTGCIENEWIEKTWRQRLEEHAHPGRAGKSQ